MSILNPESPANEPSQAEQAAKVLIHMTRQTYQQMVSSFNRGSAIFWSNHMGASPEAIASQLGTDAKEVFELHSKLGQLIASVQPNAIAEGLSVVGNFTLNDDGTVTIINNPS